MVNMNGLVVTYVDSTIFVPLPRQLWREIDGGCVCAHCRARGPGRVSYWDTMAIKSKPTDSGRSTDHTWMVHRPDQHPLRLSDSENKA